MTLLHRMVTALAFAGVAAGLALASPAHAEKRVALVIGNGTYTNAPRLPNPRNDAEDVAEALRRTDFEVILGIDLDKTHMEDVTIRFARAARDADVALFYYSGHAMQFAGINYLMPIDARLSDEADLRRMARVDDIIADLQQAKNLRILVLDSCRDNPLAEALKLSIGRTRGVAVQRGLAKVDKAQGMIMAYATQFGLTADDGLGRNSPYTAAFLKHIESSDEIGTVFRRVSADVYEATGQRQLPELSLSLIGEFYLRGRPSAVAGQPAADAAAQVWAATQNTTSQAVLESFIAQFGATVYGTMARARLEELKRSQIAAVEPSQRSPRVEATKPFTEPLTPVTPVTQRAVLYEEDPADPHGKRYAGTAVWKTETTPSAPGQAPEFIVRAVVELPERKMRMTLTIRRNTDTALPASHTIEVMFNLPPNFAPGTIASVPGILVKTEEQARGVPLAGSSVKVTDGYFLIGLSALQADRDRNLMLLRERPWFDIPIVYGNNRRALVALEKGGPGQLAFNDAFATWGQ